jgi:antitoxin component YwqK of YwqJK toxin-antitoxin module
MIRPTLLGVVLCALPAIVHAVEVCDIGGQWVNPNNGNTTAGKTGLMRCLDGEGGQLLREQEIRNGIFIGVVRYYRGGVLHREHQVNERGNLDGIAREFAAIAGGTNPLLREETLNNSTTVGRARSWYADGKLKRVSFHDDKDREQAMAGFTPQGLLSELHCADRPLLAPDADDAKMCGHQGGKAPTVLLHSDNGALRSRLTYERGERRGSELLWDSGQVREQQEITALGDIERSFSANGVKRREL